MAKDKRKHHGRFAHRIVKNGRVKIMGQVWEINKAVSGWQRFEGMKLSFGLYPPDYEHLNLWGTYEEYKGGIPIDGSSIDLRVRDGVLPWEWWKKVEKNERKEGR